MCSKSLLGCFASERLPQGFLVPHCNGNSKLSSDDARQAAKVLGGRCLSRVYVSVHKPLRWRCGAGHQFSASLTSVRTLGAFCMECQKLTLEEFQRLADSIGYTLLSNKYVNYYTHIRVLCDVGHQWDVQPKHLKEGTRCPECRYGWN